MNKALLTIILAALPLCSAPAPAPATCCKTKEACCKDTCCTAADQCCKAEPRKPCAKACTTAEAPKHHKS